MPTIVPYPEVLRTAEAAGLRCVYYNGGAFTPVGASAEIVGWLTCVDPTVRPELSDKVIYIGRATADFAGDALSDRTDVTGATGVTAEPSTAADFSRLLAERLAVVWESFTNSRAWVLPKAHWSFELEHNDTGATTEANAVHPMRNALCDLGLSRDTIASLAARTDASAIEFGRSEATGFTAFCQFLLQYLTVSDFAVLFPPTGLLVTLHHHGQIWWQTTDPAAAERVKQVGREHKTIQNWLEMAKPDNA